VAGSRPRISLCVVARDEEGFIAACLSSARAIADEVLVLDTGSTDLTPHLATAAGARVVRWRWRDDYAEAFEAMRARATGDWILNLDADETLDAVCHTAVRRLVEHPEADAYLPQIRSYHYTPRPHWRPADPCAPASCGAYGWSPSRTVRLFRNDPRYRYTGIVHHTVGPSVAAAGGTLAVSDEIVVHHYGDLRLDRTPPKAEHYRSLAERKVREEPGNGRAWIELGVILEYLRDLTGALDCFTRAASCGLGASARFFSGRTRFASGDLSGAARDLEAALREDPGDNAVDFDRADALETLARVHQARGDAAAAEDAYREALRTRPSSPAAANNLADLLARTGRTAAARPLVTALLAQYPGFDAVRCTLGNVLAAEGDDAAAERAYREALAIQPENLPARLNLARVLARTGRPVAAARAYRLAAEHIPHSGPHAALARYAPPPPRRRRVKAPPGSAPLLVSLLPYIGGGAGRVLLEVVRALPAYRHVVVCADPGSYDGLGYRQAIRRLGVPCHIVEDNDAVLDVLERTSAVGFLFHWWPTTRFAGLAERCPVPRALIGHAVMKMPAGADAYVVLSEYHRRSQGHLPPDRVHLIPNGTSLDGPGSPARGRRTRARAAMLSRLDPGKFPRRLLSYLPDLAACRGEVVVAGRGPRSFEIAPDLEAVAWADRVRFRGIVPPARVPAFLAGADVGLHLTETSLEVCSLTIIEMLAAGLPVVSQPRGCLPEMVTDGENGFLSESEEEIGERLRELFLDRALRRTMGEAAREHARPYDLRRFAASYAELAGGLVT
jgi:glycosyltransferase involved in cell wall biosynthesis/Tfp pilus assembly protein PilF